MSDPPNLRRPRERIPTFSEMEDLATMKADLVGLKLESDLDSKLESKLEGQKTVTQWLDGRLTRVEDLCRDLKGSVIFWGALPTALVAIAGIWAYFHGMKP